MKPENYVALTGQLQRLAYRYVECLVVVLCPWVLLTEQKAVTFADLAEGEEAYTPPAGVARIGGERRVTPQRQAARAAQAANKDLGGLVPLANSAEQAMLMLADRNPWLKSSARAK